jgi:hypothetical protein
MGKERTEKERLKEPSGKHSPLVGSLCHKVDTPCVEPNTRWFTCSYPNLVDVLWDLWRGVGKIGCDLFLPIVDVLRIDGTLALVPVVKLADRRHDDCGPHCLCMLRGDWGCCVHGIFG